MNVGCGGWKRVHGIRGQVLREVALGVVFQKEKEAGWEGDASRNRIARDLCEGRL